MNGCICVLRAQRRQDDKIDAAVRAEPPVDVVGSAVDGDRPTTFRQPRRQRLDHRLVAAVVGRNAAAAEDQDPRSFRVERQGLPPEPPGGCAGRHAAAGADQPPPFEDPAAVAPQPGVGGQRRGLSQQHVAENAEFPKRGREQRARGIGQGPVVELQEVSVLERVEVDFPRHLAPPPGQVDAAVQRAGPGFVNHLPASLAQPEAEFGVLTVGVKVVVEDATVECYVSQGGAQEQRRGAGAAEHPLGGRILAAVDPVGAAVDMAPASRERHAAGVDHGPVGAPPGAPAVWPAVRRRRAHLRIRPQQPPRHRAHRALLAREPAEALDQAQRIVGGHPCIRVQAQNVGRFPAVRGTGCAGVPAGFLRADERRLESPVQAAREAGVLVQRNQVDREGRRIRALTEAVDGAVGARVVDHDQPERGTFKPRERLEEPRQVRRVVPGDRADRDLHTPRPPTGCADVPVGPPRKTARGVSLAPSRTHRPLHPVAAATTSRHSPATASPRPRARRGRRSGSRAMRSSAVAVSTKRSTRAAPRL